MHNIVLDLMQDYLGKGHELYVDQYYTLIPLCSRVVCKADSSSGNMPDKQTRDAEGLFDAEHSPRRSSGMSAGAYSCSEVA